MTDETTEMMDEMPTDPWKTFTSFAPTIMMVQEIMVWIQYCAPLFYVVGMPLYGLMSYLNNLLNYIWMWICLIGFLDVQGILGEDQIIFESVPTEADMEKYSILNFILFPLRKVYVYAWLNAVGTPFLVIPLIWWLPTVIFGAL